MNDREPTTPAERVEAELRARIESEEWRTDQQLPSINSLAAQHHTSRATMTRVVGRLAEEGMLRVRPGWGTFKT